jgi:phosphohistidine phosphatase
MNFKSTVLDSRCRPGEIAAMRRLILLRHAKTERAEPGAQDRERKLTQRGRDDAPAIGAYMVRHGLIPDLAIVSPATRAQQTWALVAGLLPKAPRLVIDDRIYAATSETLVGVIAAARNAPTLIVVGHNPSLHDLALQLTGSGDRRAREWLGENLPTSGLVVIEFPFDDWSLMRPRTGLLTRFVSPRLIADLADGAKL